MSQWWLCTSSPPTAFNQNSKLKNMKTPPFPSLLPSLFSSFSFLFPPFSPQVTPMAIFLVIVVILSPSFYYREVYSMVTSPHPDQICGDCSQSHRHLTTYSPGFTFGTWTWSFTAMYAVVWQHPFPLLSGAVGESRLQSGSWSLVLFHPSYEGWVKPMLHGW